MPHVVEHLVEVVVILHASQRRVIGPVEVQGKWLEQAVVDIFYCLGVGVDHMAQWLELEVSIKSIMSHVDIM
jgi:hypothetical protein